MEVVAETGGGMVDISRDDVELVVAYPVPHAHEAVKSSESKIQIL
jgi:hypothetical protein